MDIFDKKEDLADEFINWLKKEIPKHLEQFKNNELSEELNEKKKEKKEKKGILDRVKFPDKSKKSDSLKIKESERKEKRLNVRDFERRKRNQEEFEDGLSESEDYGYKSKKKILII